MESNLSLDGAQFVALPSRVDPINIYSLRGKVLWQVRLRHWDHLQTANLAADGKSLFVTADILTGTAILHADLQRNAQVLWENPGSSWETVTHPSPDGRHLGFERWIATANMWMLENF